MTKKEIMNEVEKITYVTPASTVVLVSTTSSEGIRNIGTFAMFMMASTKPPMVIVAINPKSDTYKNIIETQEFVVGIPKYTIMDKVYLAGSKYPPEIDEFDVVKLTPYESSQLRASKIQECSVNLECKLAWFREAGNHTLFCGDVIGADIDENYYYTGIPAVELRKRVSQLYHITGKSFMINGCEVNLE